MTARGPVLGATTLVLALAACGASPEPMLLGDSMAGAAVPVLEVEGAPTVWVSSQDGSDPRPGGAPSPTMCQVTGGGVPTLVEPTASNTALGDTDLWVVAQVEGLQPPGEVTCDGPGVEHVYVGVP